MVKDGNKQSFKHTNMINLKGVKLLSKDYNPQDSLDKIPTLNRLVIEACNTNSNEQLIQKAEKIRDYINSNREDLEKKDLKGQTPLIVSAQLKRYRVSNFLLHEGANINAQDKYGNTCLHHFINHQCVYGVNLFLKKGADLTIKNKFGQTPLHVAAMNINNNKEPYGEQLNITQILLEKCSNLEEKDKKGHTAAELSYIYGNNHTLKLLLQNGAKAPDVSKVKFDSYVNPKKIGAIEEVLAQYHKSSDHGEQKDDYHITSQQSEKHVRRRSRHISDIKNPPSQIKVSIKKTMSSDFVGRLFKEEEAKSNSRY